MSRYSSSAQFSHDQPERTGVLLVQLGTPEAAEAGPVRRYLKQFLSDPRVVEIPPALWWPILNGIILRTRPAQSARKYASIWTDAGSPLLVNTQAQAKLTQGYLGNDGFDVKLAFAMRYGEPSISSQLEALREQNVTRLLVVPMYPQFAGSTTASVFDETTRVLSTWRNLPEVRFTRGDPYHCECHATARLLGAALGLPDDRWQLSFQSRFGKARWLEPYTEATLRKLGAAGTGRIDVVCPGFVVDCLETLEEIAIEGRDTFKEAGGGQFNYIACLNDSPDFIAALARLIGEHLGGWPVTAATGGPAAREAAAQARQARALAMGAERQA